MRQAAKDYVKRIIRKEKILEPICEIGSFQVPWQEGFADLRPLFPQKKYIGCDLQLGKGVDRQENVHYLTFPDESIGTVLILDTLEHVANVYRAMEEIYRVLKPGGVVVMSSVMNYPVHDFPHDYWRFTPQAFELLLEKFGRFEVEFDGEENFPTGIYGYGVKGGRGRSKIKYHGRVNLKDSNDSHTKIIKLIGRGKNILEFGCSTGFMSKVLKKNGCQVVGVEIDSQAAKKAVKYCQQVIVGDIEKIDYRKKLGKQKFDFIVFADVLEHLRDPRAVLLKIKNFLKKSGKLVISVPNITHASVRLELLTGDFEYGNLGILDETHLKYFTKKSVIRLLDSCGYFIERIEAVSKGLSKQTLKKFLAKIGIKDGENLVKMFNQPEALAYQYIIVASLKEPVDYSILGVLSKPIKTIDDTEEKIERLNRQLESLFETRGWRIISFLHQMRMRIPIVKKL